MLIQLECNPWALVVLVRFRVDPDDGTHRGIFFRFLGPGDSFEGWTFAQLLSLGNGRHHLDNRRAPVAGAVCG